MIRTVLRGTRAYIGSVSEVLHGNSDRRYNTYVGREDIFKPTIGT
jgi:hypothetical protein